MLTPAKTGFTIEWDKDGERKYETGVERGVIYPMNPDGTYGNAVAWNGLTNVEESPSGAESNPVYADDQKYLDLRSIEEYGYTITALMYPDEFAECDGSAFLDGANGQAKALKVGQQKRKSFGFCYTTKVGNDVEQSDYGYKIHLCYNSTASPASRSHGTENESPEAPEMSWECSTIGVRTNFAGRNVAHMEIDMNKLSAEQRNLLEYALFGNGTTPGRFLTPDQVYELLYAAPAEVAITISPVSIENLEVGSDATITVTQKVPSDATVTWATSDSTIATVVDGVVTGEAVGNATITATVTNGEETTTAQCVVKVVTPSSEG